MTKTYDLYGTSFSPEQLRDQLSELLGVEFTAHDSSYKGEYFWAGDLRGEQFEIQPNQIPGDDGEWDLMEEDFAEYQVLLYVNRTERPDEVRELLRTVPELAHLRREVI